MRHKFTAGPCRVSKRLRQYNQQAFTANFIMFNVTMRGTTTCEDYFMSLNASARFVLRTRRARAVMRVAPSPQPGTYPASVAAMTRLRRS